MGGHLLLLLVLLLPPCQARSVGVVGEESLPGWLLLPRNKASLAWLRTSRPGNFWAVMSLDTGKKEAHTRPGTVKYVDTVTETLSTPLSLLHKTWFSKYSPHKSLPAFSTINNGHHQATPVYYGDITKTTTTTINPYPSYYVPTQQHRRPSFFLLIFKIIPRNIYFWFKNEINNLLYS